jgi:hypothetical protein
MIRIKKFFRKKEAEQNEGMSSFKKCLAGLHRKMADHLNARARRWSTAQVKVMLVCFCLAAGGYCCYVMVRAIVYGNGPPGKALYGVGTKTPLGKTK